MFKALIPDVNDKGIILVRGVPFGNPSERDMHGHFFSERTNFLSHIMPLPPVLHFHGFKSGSLPDPIGETISREQRSDGVWYKAKLFIDSNIDAIRTKAVQLWEAAKSQRLFASSGAVEGMIKIAESGEILQWLVGEISLLDTRNDREIPSSFHAVVKPIKSASLDEIPNGNTSLSDVNIISEVSPDPDPDLEPEPEPEPVVVEENIRSDKEMSSNSTPPSDDLQTQLVETMALVNNLQAQLNEQNAEIQRRDETITELQKAVTTKSAEAAMSSYVSLVDNWIQDGKIAPSERKHALEVLAMAYQSDVSTKSGNGQLTQKITDWVNAKSATIEFGQPSAIYNNVGTQTQEGPGGGVDPEMLKVMMAHAEIEVD